MNTQYLLAMALVLPLAVSCHHWEVDPGYYDLKTLDPALELQTDELYCLVQLEYGKELLPRRMFFNAEGTRHAVPYLVKILEPSVPTGTIVKITHRERTGGTALDWRYYADWEGERVDGTFAERNLPRLITNDERIP